MAHLGGGTNSREGSLSGLVLRLSPKETGCRGTYSGLWDDRLGTGGSNHGEVGQARGWGCCKWPGATKGKAKTPSRFWRTYSTE